METAVIEIAIAPRSPEDGEAIADALRQIAAGDQRLHVSGADGGYFLLSGLGEEHLDTRIGDLKSKVGDRFLIGAPQVAYRETIGCAATVDYTHKRLTGDGAGEFARVKIEFEPGARGAGFTFESKVIGGKVPTEHIPSIRRGLETAASNGLLAGYPVIDLTARLIDGAYHDLDSDARTFQIAAQAAFRELKEKGDPRLLEPIMQVEVTTPTEFAGAIINDLSSRRGVIGDKEAQRAATVIHAMAPMSAMLGYSNMLRQLTQGRASHAMTLSHYEPVPRNDRDPPSAPAIGMRA